MTVKIILLYKNYLDVLNIILERTQTKKYKTGKDNGLVKKQKNFGLISTYMCLRERKRNRDKERKKEGKKNCVYIYTYI